MLNPNTYIRMGLIEAFIAEGITVPVWAKVVPKSVNPTPSTYILISNQSKNPTEQSKDCWEWEVTTAISIFRVNAQGFTNTIPLDNLEGQVMSAIERGINVPNFMVKDTTYVDSVSLDFETPTQTVERTVVTFTHWLEEIGPGPVPTKKNTINAMPPEAEWQTIFDLTQNGNS